MGGPNYDKNLHANRKYSIPWSDGSGRGKPFRRSHHLYSDAGQGTAIQTSFGQQQSMSEIQYFDVTDPTLYPQLWAKANKLLRVPKIVILSSFCHWWEMWEQCAFMYPNAQPFTICNQSLLNPYCGVLQLDTGNYDGNRYAGAGQTNTSAPVLNNGGQYYRGIGTVQNPMSAQHRQLLQSWQDLADQVNNDANDPLYIIVPQWVPSKLAAYTHFNGCANYVFNGRPWYLNAQPEYNWVPNGEGLYLYPAADKPENQNPFSYSPGVPCLLTAAGGFRTNVLHLWCGHWCQTMLGTGNCFGFESWPLGPPGDFLAAGMFEGNYTYNGTIATGFCGIRQTWYDCGPAFGYTSIPGDQMVDYYDKNGILATAAQSYMDNYLKFRNFGVRLFTYDQDVDTSVLDWSKIMADRHTEHSGFFYFGSDHCCDMPGRCTEDDTCNDTVDPTGLKFGEAFQNRPTLQTFRDAYQYYWSKISARLQAYYGGLNEGTEAFYNGMIGKYGLDGYNVQYGGSASQVSGGAALDYARQYFAEQEQNYGL